MPLDPAEKGRVLQWPRLAELGKFRFGRVLAVNISPVPTYERYHPCPVTSMQILKFTKTNPIGKLL